MTGAQFRAIRQRLGLKVRQFALALGYRGNDNTNSVLIRQYELGTKELPPRTERLAIMFDRFGVPSEWLN